MVRMNDSGPVRFGSMESFRGLSMLDEIEAMSLATGAAAVGAGVGGYVAVAVIKGAAASIAIAGAWGIDPSAVRLTMKAT
jgi:hypothetical protein